MSRIVLELTHNQAEEWIRDLGRAIVLLDLAQKRIEDAKQRSYYLVQTLRLQEMIDAMDDAAILTDWADRQEARR